MKRITLLVTLLMVVSLAVLSQVGCGEGGTNRAVTTSATNTNSAEAPVDTAAIEAELMRIERDWPRIIKEKDVETVRRVEADDALIVYPDGELGSKEQDIRDTQSGALSAESWEVTDLKVKVLDKDAALASGRSIVKGGKYRTADGRVLDISGQYRFIDTFARRDGQWKLVAGIGTPIQRPPTAATGSPSAASSPAAGATKPPPPTPTPTASPKPSN